MSLENILNIAGSGMAAESTRLTAASTNLANANSITSSKGTPFRAKEVVLAAKPLGQGEGTGVNGVRVAGIVNSKAPFKRVYDPSSPFANKQGYVRKTNVNPVAARMNTLSASSDYKADMNQAKIAKSLVTQLLNMG